MTPKERAAMQQALEALDYAATMSDFVTDKETYEEAITALREALAEPQITTPDVCGEVCARAKLCYGCNKDLEEANAKYVEKAEQEPVACQFPRQPNNEGGWTIDPKFLNILVKDMADDEFNVDMEETEAVLLALERSYAEPVKTYEQGFLDGYDAGLIFANSRVEPVKQEPVAFIGQGLKPIVPEDLEKLRKHEPGMATLYDTPLYAAPQPVKHEPVAWGRIFDGDIIDCICPEEHALNEGDYTVPLYAAPVQQVDLTDDEIWEAAMKSDGTILSAHRAVIAADREKNK